MLTFVILNVILVTLNRLTKGILSTVYLFLKRRMGSSLYRVGTRENLFELKHTDQTADAKQLYLFLATIFNNILFKC